MPHGTSSPLPAANALSAVRCLMARVGRGPVCDWRNKSAFLFFVPKNTWPDTQPDQLAEHFSKQSCGAGSLTQPVFGVDFQTRSPPSWLVENHRAGKSRKG